MSSILRIKSAAGMAMTTRMTTGTMVHMISTFVLCTMVVSAMAPWEWRNLTSE